ncbi:hypothetical protein PF001_g9790 [Phytophthora fragariae]|uniref:Uncharacterized protein n=1 Tax=Phytophthora fragariae TaxID=53985 RepID=A0A6A4DRC8_9STRA|nr:hypothetical protein PF001_g9790 [Phytophthora fragariae]
MDRNGDPADAPAQVVTDRDAVATEVPREDESQNAHARDSQASDRSTKRMGRLEELIEGLLRPMAQDRSTRPALPRSPCSEPSSLGTSAFGEFLRAHRQRMRANSLEDDPMAPAQPMQSHTSPVYWTNSLGRHRLISRRSHSSPSNFTHSSASG